VKVRLRDDETNGTGKDSERGSETTGTQPPEGDSGLKHGVRQECRL